MIFSADDPADVGEDGGTPVSEDYKSSDSKFTGKINKITVELKNSDPGSKAEADKAAKEAAVKKAISD
jgi:arylsulfatase